MADTTVKFIHSAMPGAPVLTGQAGSLIGLLDACLVNGFGAGNVDSLVIAGGVATVTRSAGHPFEVGSVALIAGATVSGGSVNGEQKVLAVTTTTYTFDATGLSNQTATGTISHKVAPLGWLKPFAGTNLAAYKSADPASTGMLLRVDDTSTASPNPARVVGYESMADINTGTGPFPTSAQISGGAYWPKSASGDATAREWVLCGDGRLFYLAIAHMGGTAFSLMQVFGDPVPAKSSDPYCCLILGNSGPTASSPGGNGAELDYHDAAPGSPPTLYMPRSYTALGSSISMRKVAGFVFLGSTTMRSGQATSSQLLPYPNYSDGGVYVVPHYLVEHATLTLRATSPGFYFFGNSVSNTVFANKYSLVGTTGLPGRTLRVLNSSQGCFAFDTTGPWR